MAAIHVGVEEFRDMKLQAIKFSSAGPIIASVERQLSSKPSPIV